MGDVYDSVDTRIVIGELELQPSRPGYFWLCYLDGEGMEVEEEKLADLLLKFYQENF